MNVWQNYVDAATQLAEFREVAEAEVEQLLNEQEQRRSTIPATFEQQIEHVDAADEAGKRMLSNGRQTAKRYGVEHLLAAAEPLIDPALDPHLDVRTARRRAKAALDELETAALFRTTPSDVLGVITATVGALIALAVALGVVVLIVIQFI